MRKLILPSILTILSLPLLLCGQCRSSYTQSRINQTYVSGFVQNEDLGTVNKLIQKADIQNTIDTTPIK